MSAHRSSQYDVSPRRHAETLDSRYAPANLYVPHATVLGNSMSGASLH